MIVSRKPGSVSLQSPRRQPLRSWLAALAALSAVTACQEKLTSAVDCPELCPGGTPVLFDTTLTAATDRDSSYIGYVSPGLGASLRASNGLAASEDRAFWVFLRRPDSIRINDTSRTYVIDSVSVGMTIQARDTLVTGLKLFLYRLPVDVDSTTTFAGIDSNLVMANLVDSIAVPDSQHTGFVGVVLSGADLARVDIPPADSGRLAIGIAITADAPTGVRLAGIAATGTPVFTTWATANVADTTLRKQALNRFPSYASFVAATLPVPDPMLLTVGGAPSSRALVRFALPPALRDSATIVRVTLELTTDSPVLGLPTDPAVLQAWAIVGDLGSKSPLLSNTSLTTTALIPDGISGTVTVDVTRMVRAWQGSAGLPQAVYLLLAPEAASFSRADFRSTRSPSGAPRLRVTYTLGFPFERP